MAVKTAKGRAASADGSPDGQSRDVGAGAVPARAARRVAHLTPDERMARGKAARNEVPRSSHGRWAPAHGRPDPVALLEEQGESRVPELVPIRYGRMLVSPFTFFRGAALIMAADLAATSRSGLNVQSCGDAHLSNFGVFASPERQLMFDINDFDETLPGPWEWDLKRLGASLEVAGRDRGYSAAERRKVVLTGAAEYRTRMQQAAGMRNLDVWYAHIEVQQLFERFKAEVSGKQLAKAKSTVAKARTRDTMQAFSKLTREVDGQRRIIADPPLIVPVEDLLPEGRERGEVESELRSLIRSYRRTLETDRRHLLEEYEFVHMARKVVGVGSVGTRAWILLLLGRDGQRPAVPAGQGGPGVGAGTVRRNEPVPEPWPAGGCRSAPDAGRQRHLPRLAAGSRIRRAPRDFYIRQLRDWKGSADVDTMTASGMAVYARLCGATLARAHARSGDRIAMPPTWAMARFSTERSPISRPRTPTRTNATTKPSSTPSSPDASWPRPAYESDGHSINPKPDSAHPTGVGLRFFPGRPRREHRSPAPTPGQDRPHIKP